MFKVATHSPEDVMKLSRAFETDLLQHGLSPCYCLLKNFHVLDKVVVYLSQSLESIVHLFDCAFLARQRLERPRSESILPSKAWSSMHR